MRRPAGRKRPDAGAWFQHIAPRFARHHAAGGQHRPLREREIRAIYDAALRLLADLGIGEVPETGRVASITGQARSTLTRENGQPTDSNLAQPSSVILLRARTPICASVF